MEHSRVNLFVTHAPHTALKYALATANLKCHIGIDSLCRCIRLVRFPAIVQQSRKIFRENIRERILSWSWPLRAKGPLAFEWCREADYKRIAC